MTSSAQSDVAPERPSSTNETADVEMDSPVMQELDAADNEEGVDAGGSSAKDDPVDRSNVADKKERQAAIKSEGDEQNDGKMEQHYSTRGRHNTKEGDQNQNDRAKNHRDFEHDEPSAREPNEKTNMPTTSFLDALGEEEKRMRTRFIPTVSGMHGLYKSEVKQDMGLARAIMSASGVTRRTRKRGKGEDDPMEVDEEDATGHSEDDIQESGLVVENVAIPSRAFVGPPDTSLTENGDGELLGRKINHPSKSPHEVESITTFNPPRPPESVGPKKKHRMLRWERRPHDVDIDLMNYKKTVQRTREELRNAEGERERIEGAASLLRTHFISHLQALNEEGAKLNEEFGKVQQECVAAADLLTSRTRSRGVGKGSYVMKDVLAVLKQREAEKEPKRDTVGEDVYVQPTGVGGINLQSFGDWDRSTDFKPSKLAEGWILAGDKVQTPYGYGTVLDIVAPSALNVRATPVAGTMAKPSSKAASTVVHGFRGTEGTLTNGISTRTNGVKAGDVQAKEASDGMVTSMKEILPPRVCVQLPFGVGYFPVDAVKVAKQEGPFSDAELVRRWKQSVKSALAMGSCIDYTAMSQFPVKKKSLKEASETKGDEGDEMEMDGENTETIERFIPFASGMLPTASGRGAAMMTPPSQLLEKEMHEVVLSGGGVLGTKDNQGLPAGFRKWEDTREGLCKLRAHVLQRRNELNRQRRIRIQNEKTLSATRDRTRKIEALVSEMRADLKSLKDRLDEELAELGIGGELAGKLLSAYYRDQAGYEDDTKMDKADGQQRDVDQKRRGRDEEMESNRSHKKLRPHQ